MKATLTRRAMAWVIDLLVVLFVVFLVGLLYKPDVSFLDSKIDFIMVSFLEGNISFFEYIASISDIYKQIDMANIVVNIIYMLVLIGYFVFLPYFNQGMTIGKKLQKIQVRSMSNQELTLGQLLIRNMIINGLFYLIMVILCTLVVNSSLYFFVITGLGFIQIIFICISVIMVVWRKDRRALHDIVSKTWVATVR